MRFALLSQYTDFFFKHGIIEFEDIFSNDDADLLLSKLERLQSGALGKKPRDLASNEDLWKAGRISWEEDPDVKKLLLRSGIGSIAAFLFKKKPVRAAYIQCFFTESGKDCPFPSEASLTDVSAASPILGGILLCLTSSDSADTEQSLPNLQNRKKGRGFFFSDQYPIPFSALFQQAGARYLLICLAQQKVRYKPEMRDPHVHALKKKGYAFGDVLLEKEAPYLLYS